MALYEVKYVKGEASYTFVPVQATSSTSSSQQAEKYTCDRCGLRFVSELRLEWHRSTHEPLKNCKQASSRKQTTRKEKAAAIKLASRKLKFICPSCEFSTSERQLMIKHFAAKHCMKVSELKKSSSRTRKRSSGSNISNSSNDKYHQQEDGKRKEDEEEEEKEHRQVEEVEEQAELTELICAQCGFSSYDQDDLDFHTCTRAGEEPATFSCHLCTYECLTRMGLQSHITRKHKPKPGSEIPARYACDECDYKCANKNTMYSHKRKHRSKPVLRCETDTETESKPKPKPKPKGKHKRKRSGPGAPKSRREQGPRCGSECTFFCNECDYSTSRKSALYQHIKRSHDKRSQDENFHAVPGREDLLFGCDQCPYTNKNRYEMKVHVIRKHSNEYNYECEQCGKKYKIKGDLTNHIRFQHREQPIICDVCGKTCGNSNSLYVHQKFAHYKAQFECPICHRRMVSKANLEEHVLKQHEQREDAICEECGKTFTRQSRLKIHMRIHLGIKPHACRLCGKAFSRKTALRQHLLIHSGQRPYICDICGKSFTQKPGLISHRKSHPGTHPPLPRVTIDHVLSDLLTAQES